MIRFRLEKIPPGPAWLALWIVFLGASVFHVGMEWVFFATKPSFMSTLTAWERMQILLLAPVPLAVASAALAAGLGLAETIAPRARDGLVRAGAMGPGLIWASAFLLLLDNFTYTLFQVGVPTASGGWRLGYLLLFGLFWFGGWRLSLGLLLGAMAWRNPTRTIGRMALALVILWGLLLATGPVRERAAPADALGAAGLPNILILASDGVSAEHLSLYGYGRDTTPFLRTFAEGKALICENAFANALNSGSSIASMLTGKLPTTLRMYYPPEILTGRNAYEHLPGLLRQRGYENVDISARQFADAYDLNLLHSFHEANGRTEEGGRWRRLASERLGLPTGYFLGSTWERLRDRLLHIVGATDFESAYDVVAGEASTGAELEDEPRIDRLLRLIAARRDRPFFAHVHLIETHGPNFHLRNPQFSKGRKQAEPYERDFYDDAILGFDATVERIVRALEAAGQGENTILVLSSDHGKGWSAERIPLVFWFPGGAHAGRIRTNAQNLDMAPTLLDYLGIPIPEWMEGRSLLDGEASETRPIFLTAVNSRLVSTRKWILDESRLKPPFYSLGTLSAGIGNRMFSLDLESGKLSADFVSGHTRRLAPSESPSMENAREILLNHLEENGYALPTGWRPQPGRRGAVNTRED